MDADKPGAGDLNGRARSVRGVFLDVDGVLTDGSITFDADGRETKTFNVKDGVGLRMLIKAGTPVCLITGRSSAVVAMRAAELGIDEVYQGVRDKVAVFESVCARWNITPSQAAFVADDLPDLPVFALVGLAVAVADASVDVLSRAHMITRSGGGRGAVREVAELILRSRGDWPSANR